MTKKDEIWRKKLKDLCDASLGGFSAQVYNEIVADVEDWADERVEEAEHIAVQYGSWQAS